tara:strand:- start:170088 stop:173369 length:3282 start_codon:yes stop_codon:yes gene_type:complete
MTDKQSANTNNVNFLDSEGAGSIDLSGIAPANALHIAANGSDSISINSAQPLTQGRFIQDGTDLKIDFQDGQDIVIHDYFLQSNAPDLTSTNGQNLSSQLVDSFLINKNMRYAQGDQIISDENGAQPIGQITETSGEVKITRSAGQLIKAENGTLIYQGDIIETADNGAVNIMFADESSFAISNDARMTIDEFIFDASSLDGISNFSMLQGVFMYTSGAIGGSDPDDVRIDTPIGSIGIRGTVLVGTITADGTNSEITVIEGAIVVSNKTGERVLSQQFDTVQLNGIEDNIVELGILNANDVAARTQGIQGVAGGFYNTLQHNAEGQSRNNERNDSEQAEGQAAQDDASREDGAEQTRPALDNKTGEPPAPTNGGEFKPLQLRGRLGGSDADALQGINPQAGDTTRTGTNIGTQPLGDGPLPQIGSEPTPPSLLKPSSTDTNTENIPTRINLNAVDGASNAHKIYGIRAGDQYGAVITTAHNAATGFDDLVFFRGDHSATTSGNFVTLTGSSSLGANINISANPYTDFTDNAANSSRENVTSAISGDFDGDGVNELIIGAAQGSNSFASNQDDGVLYTYKPDGSAAGGYANYGGAVSSDGNQQLFGQSLANVGDLNNDGYTDLAIGAPGGTADTGRVRLELNGTDLLNITQTINYSGMTTGDYLGGDVTGLGDINGDGYDDFAIGVYDGMLDGSNVTSNLNSFYILSGGANPSFFDALTDGLRVDGGTGFGRHIEGVGDINADGFNDILVNESTTGLKLLYGKSALGVGNTSQSSFSQFNLDVSGDGYTIETANAAGDFNADGHSDFVVMMRNGLDVKIAIILGSDSLAGVTANLQYLEDHSEVAYMIDYTLDSLPSGTYHMDFAYGDYDGDGFDDIAISDPMQDSAYIIEGSKVGHARALYMEGNNLAADGNDKYLTGTALNDKMGQNGKTGLTFNGGAGLDGFIINNAETSGVANFQQIDGGGGTDRLTLSGGQGSIDFSNINQNQIQRIEQINVGSGNDLKFNVQQIFDLLKSSDNGSLRITALDTGSTLTIESTGNHTDDFNGIGDSLENLTAINGIAPSTAGGYQQYDIGGYELFIDSDFAVATTQKI